MESRGTSNAARRNQQPSMSQDAPKAGTDPEACYKKPKTMIRGIPKWFVGQMFLLAKMFFGLSMSPEHVEGIPKCFCWPSVFWEAWGAKAKRPHMLALPPKAVRPTNHYFPENV